MSLIRPVMTAMDAMPTNGNEKKALEKVRQLEREYIAKAKPIDSALTKEMKKFEDDPYGDDDGTMSRLEDKMSRLEREFKDKVKALGYRIKNDRLIGNVILSHPTYVRI